MLDIEKQINHWCAGATEDWDVACSLVSQGKLRHGLFFAHLTLEKVLKAHVCRTNRELAPPIHNLIRLVERANLSLEPEQRNLLAEVNSFNIEGRYPELFLPLPSQQEADNYIDKIGEMVKCLNRLF